MMSPSRDRISAQSSGAGRDSSSSSISRVIIRSAKLRARNGKLAVGEARRQFLAAAHSEEPALNPEAGGLEPAHPFRRGRGDINGDALPTLRRKATGCNTPRDFGALGHNRPQLPIKVTGSSETVSQHI